MVESSQLEIEFKEYPEIENHFNRDVKKMLETYSTEELWVATEKVHGTNFSFIHNGSAFKCAKRTSLLENTDSFYNF